MVCVLCTSKRDGPGRRAMVLCVVEVWRRRTFGTSDSEPRTRSCCCRSPVPAHPGGSRCQIRVFFSRLTSGTTCTFFSINVTKKDFSQRQKSLLRFPSVYTPFRVLLLKTGLFFCSFRTGTALANLSATTIGTRVEIGPEGLLRRNTEMMNRHTLKFSIFAATILALALPAAASAQWGGYPQNRYPDNRSGRYDDRGLRVSVHRIDR